MTQPKVDIQKLSIEYALLKGLDSKNFEQIKRLEELEKMMTNKPKTNKWVENKIKKILEKHTVGAYEKDDEIKVIRVWDALDELSNFITQTQQETLDWCEKEIKKLRVEEEEIDLTRADDQSYIEGLEFNEALKKVSQTIKQRKEEGK